MSHVVESENVYIDPPNLVIPRTTLITYIIPRLTPISDNDDINPKLSPSIPALFLPPSIPAAAEAAEAVRAGAETAELKAAEPVKTARQRPREASVSQLVKSPQRKHAQKGECRRYTVFIPEALLSSLKHKIKDANWARKHLHRGTGSTRNHVGYGGSSEN